MSEAQPGPGTDLPESLWRDRSFWGMTATQFLGAFNDNLFKQVVLLLCIDIAVQHGTRDYQPQAQRLFALPFVLFSGFAGYLSDRFSKRRIAIICKVFEIAIVALGTWSLSLGSLPAVFVVLFCMGTHSAFFGPAKYGILPELVREPNLPVANGVFLMTTFIGIIVGTMLAGRLKGFVDDNILLVGAAYSAVAATGLMTSLLIRNTPVAHPGLRFAWSDLAVSGETLRMFWRDKPLLLALIMYSVFWLIGGLTQSTVNVYGKLQVFGHLGIKQADAAASLMLGFLVIGIALGCVTAGWMSGNRVNFRLVPWGAWGMVIGLGLLAAVGWLGTGRESADPFSAGVTPAEVTAEAGEPIAPRSDAQESAGAGPILSSGIVSATSKLLLLLMGMAAGIFTVPLQVFLQSRPPSDQKGRVIGAMNLVNWIGLLFSAEIYSAFDVIRAEVHAPHSAIFGGTALLLLPVALLYRPRETPRPAA
jgi:acyl-[acyl-carrier-protein]-phospholipid O-acyltransferase/long-chain-fatty-acid--[acyl-carrier-protein] ligase